MSDAQPTSAWRRFWHQPIRAESLALMRIALAAALLTDQLFQYLPNFAEFFGPDGIAPAGLYERYKLMYWRWTALFFETDNYAILYPVFALWVAATIGWMIGWKTRWMNALVWLLTMTFIDRNPFLLNGGDDTLQVGILLLLFSPCGKALSVDARRAARTTGPAMIPPWSVRLIQIQLCLIYLTTGLAKVLLCGVREGTLIPNGTWWDGTSIHYAINYVSMSRWSYAQFPVPIWITAPLTYISVWWEVLFTPLVLWRRTRRLALIFGLIFHLGIWFTIEVGWFSFYTMCFYAVWVSESFWDRRDIKRKLRVAALGETVDSLVST